MPSANDKDKPGRVTPRKGTDPVAKAKPRRRSIAPARIGPFEKPDRDKPVGQVGRRPSSPYKLMLFASVYLVSGVAAFFLLKGSIAVILGVVLIGVGLLWLRGAFATILRQNKRSQGD